jgi:hypothetical protein
MVLHPPVEPATQTGQVFREIRSGRFRGGASTTVAIPYRQLLVILRVSKRLRLRPSVLYPRAMLPYSLPPADLATG